MAMQRLRPRLRAAVAAGARCQAASALALSLALAGCGAGHILDRSETPELQPRDGFLALAVETNKRCAVTVCRDADMIHCTSFAGLTASHDLVVSVLPAGRYCLSTIIAEDPGGGMAYVLNFEADNTSCVDVTAGRIASPGYLVLRDDKGGGVGWDSERDVTGRLRATHPKLARWPLVKVPVVQP